MSHVTEYFHTHGLSSNTHVMGGDPLIPSRAIASGHSNLPVNCMTGVGLDDTRLPQDEQEPQEQPGCELQWAGPEMHIAHHLAR